MGPKFLLFLHFYSFHFAPISLDFRLTGFCAKGKWFCAVGFCDIFCSDRLVGFLRCLWLFGCGWRFRLLGRIIFLSSLTGILRTGGIVMALPAHVLTPSSLKFAIRHCSCTSFPQSFQGIFYIPLFYFEVLL